jgi:hypothetical protein
MMATIEDSMKEFSRVAFITSDNNSITIIPFEQVSHVGLKKDDLVFNSGGTKYKIKDDEKSIEQMKNYLRWLKLKDKNLQRIRTIEI